MNNIDTMIKKDVEYSTSDGFVIRGSLTIPEKPKAFVVLMHGITVNRDEYLNFYVEFSDYLSKKGIASLRFDFRGHGKSKGTSQDVSVIGEILDIKASIKHVRKYWSKKIGVIASSFSAGPAIMCSTQLASQIQYLALIAPVLDYEKTFLNPKTDWAKESFTTDALNNLDENGYLLLDENFKLSPKLIEEFRTIKPYEFLRDLKMPIVLIHGDRDSMVPYAVSAKYSKLNKHIRFARLRNADHGFPDHDDELGQNHNSQSNKLKIFQLVENLSLKIEK